MIFVYQRNFDPLTIDAPPYPAWGPYSGNPREFLCTEYRGECYVRPVARQVEAYELVRLVEEDGLSYWEKVLRVFDPDRSIDDQLMENML